MDHMKVCFVSALNHAGKPPWHTLLTNSYILCACLSPSQCTHSSCISPDLDTLSKLSLRLAWIGGLHNPFLLIASDLYQLGIFYLLHIFDMTLRCAVSSQIQEVMSPPMHCVPKVLFILNTVSLKFLLILLAWKRSSQGYTPILTDEINLSCLPKLQWITAHITISKWILIG